MGFRGWGSPMHIISKKRLREFWERHTDAETPLSAWHSVTEKHRWKSFHELRQVYPSADQVGRFIVFNIGGNNYRLIVTIRFDYGRVYVRHVLTHAEYDKNRWKE